MENRLTWCLALMMRVTRSEHTLSLTW